MAVDKIFKGPVTLKLQLQYNSYIEFGLVLCVVCIGMMCSLNHVIQVQECLAT